MPERFPVVRFLDGLGQPPEQDDVAVEAPLEIRVEGQPIAVAMRTPGHDRELACGWALAEGIIRSATDLADIVSRPGDEAQPAAMVDVMLRDPAAFEAAKYRRNILSNASCGLCSVASVDRILRDFPKIPPGFRLDPAILPRLPGALRAAQPTFDRTGGVHACALFDLTGQIVALREDVGRHNALDKLLGWALLENRLPLSHVGLLLSGRVSLEMVQKALAGGIPLIAALGAPSSLAIRLATEAGQGLIGFLRERTWNVYSGFEN